ncbi:YcxB family protein [Aggregatimonas sangjinii]|uniref:YcxB family protein n=1 Tax=Aggregatimonas sangjinii TaxID=2583587 RepID=A0A5B7SWM8_9FLAO|nr:YcxB family protein [Aggregatimonas sangjinii]QCX01341.1 YcxB family protein [Aggregatimonas sangjinii]
MAVRKWRRQIKEYLDSQEKYESHKIVVTDEYFSIIQDNEETIEKWSNFKRVKIFDSHIWLLGTENFIIPAKSMSPLEFNNLKRLVSTKFK